MPTPPLQHNLHKVLGGSGWVLRRTGGYPLSGRVAGGLRLKLGVRQGVGCAGAELGAYLGAMEPSRAYQRDMR